MDFLEITKVDYSEFISLIGRYEYVVGRSVARFNGSWNDGGVRQGYNDEEEGQQQKYGTYQLHENCPLSDQNLMQKRGENLFYPENLS